MKYQSVAKIYKTVQKYRHLQKWCGIDIKLKELPESMARELDEPMKDLEIRQIISTLKNKINLSYHAQISSDNYS